MLSRTDPIAKGKGRLLNKQMYTQLARKRNAKTEGLVYTALLNMWKERLVRKETFN